MPSSNLDRSRIGLYYYPDTMHYRESDLAVWLPEMINLGARWVTLQSPSERAIPEPFIKGLIQAGITPILHFQFPTHHTKNIDWIQFLFNVYARWGVKYIALFDRPNVKSSWSSTSWTQNDLVERFLDLFIPISEILVQNELTPIFPPLEPGGDYWDLSFLRAALRGMCRRGKTALLDKLIFSTSAWVGNRTLNWGAGGPEYWPEARPYNTPPDSEDHLGFRIFDWYQAIIKAELGETRPIILLKVADGDGTQKNGSPACFDSIAHAATNLAIAQLMSETPDLELDPVPPEVMACCFWLLAASYDSPYHSRAWFQTNHTALPIVNVLRQWIGTREAESMKTKADPEINLERDTPGRTNLGWKPEDPQPAIGHYLLLPLYAWGAAEWELEAIKPYIQKHHPTVGFSIDEACRARHVTIYGSANIFASETYAKLSESGCKVERLAEDGSIREYSRSGNYL